MDGILFLCTGNTCRSPMAEGFFRALGGEMRLGLQADSAGLHTCDGLPASEYAREAAHGLGADLSAHRSRQFTPAMGDAAKYLVCMTGAQYDLLLAEHPAYEGKLYTLAPQDIADPFGGSLDAYRHAASQIYEAVERLMVQMEGAKL